MTIRLLTKLVSAAVLAACFALPMAAQAAPPHPLGVSKPMVDHDLEVARRQWKRSHAAEHSSSPARHKAPGRSDNLVKASPHSLDPH